MTHIVEFNIVPFAGVSAGADDLSHRFQNKLLSRPIFDPPGFESALSPCVGLFFKAS